MIRLRPSGADEVLIKRVRDWYEPGPGVFIEPQSLFSPAMLFTGSTTGGWYDPSDLTTLYQDAAGTTPVTAVEQPVGRMLDKSGKGNHAFNPSGNSANFPVLSARYNLLTKTEDFSDAVWTKTAYGTGVVPAITYGVLAPNGTNTAIQVVFDTGSGTTSGDQSELSYYAAGGAVTGVSYKSGIFVKGAVGAQILIRQQSAAGYVKHTLTGGWDYLTQNETSALNAVNLNIGLRQAVNGTINSSITVSIWHPDLRVANDALNQPAYQRVNTSTDYDTVGFKPAEVFDGVDDNLIASAGGGSTTAFFWCSAIRVGKVGAVQTLFSDAGTNTGYRVRINASNQLELSAGNGTAYTTVATTATLSIGQRAVLTAWHDGTNLNVQINNGTVHQAAFATAAAGTAQFTIGKDNNAASNFFAGRLYEKVYTKDNVPSSAQITSTKTYVANVAGITLS